MTSSRTPIRLTPHRGPLATPSASPESSPTSSTPPSDISCCSATTASSLDIALLQHRISTLSPPMQYESMSPLLRRRRQALPQELFGCRAHFSRLSLTFEDLAHSACDLAKALSGIVTFYLLLWGLLEWAPYATELTRQPMPWLSTKHFPLPFPSRTRRCHTNPSVCEPSNQQLAIFQFLSEQVQHAKALSSLSAGLGPPLRTFIEVHRTTMPRVLVPHFTELPHIVQEGDTSNLTELLDASLLDFTSGSFVGRSFTLALDELGDLISDSMVSPTSTTHGEYRDARLHAIYWRTASNLILEYSAARPRARRLLRCIHALHQRVSPFISRGRAEGLDERSNIWWWQHAVRHPANSAEDRIRAFVTGLEIALGNTQRLVDYLDWITEQLAQTTLKDVLEIRLKTDFTSCLTSLQELFAQSKPVAPKKPRFDLSDYRVTSSNPPECRHHGSRQSNSACRTLIYGHL